MQNPDIAPADTDFVTVTIDEQLFGLPISRVRDVFVPARITRVPLAPPNVAGILNLRGRIITAIDMRVCLGSPARPDGAQPLAVGIDLNGESFALLVDAVGEVLRFDAAACEPNPAHLDPELERVSAGVVRLDSTLLVILDIGRVLDLKAGAIAA